MRSYEFHPEAQAELLEITQRYLSQDEAVGEDFRAEVRRAVESILENPEASQVIAAHGVRRKVLQRFPHGLYYILRAGCVFIIALGHHKRRPGYWRERLKP